MRGQRDRAHTNTQRNGIKNLEKSSAGRTRSDWSLDQQDMIRMMMEPSHEEMTNTRAEDILSYKKLLLDHLQLLPTEKEDPRLHKMHVDAVGRFKLDQRTLNEVELTPPDSWNRRSITPRKTI